MNKESRFAIGTAVAGIAITGALIGLAFAVGPVPAQKAKTAAAANAIVSSPVPVVPTTYITPSAPSCSEQVSAWRDSGVADQLASAMSDMTSVQEGSYAVAMDISTGADASADEATLGSDFSSMQTDIETLQGNLPPSCIPNMRKDLSAGLSDMISASVLGQAGVSNAQSGDYSQATTDLSAATADMNSGSDKISAATADAKAYSP